MRLYVRKDVMLWQITQTLKRLADMVSLLALAGQTVDVRHTFYPFVEGVSERTYTDEQLAHIDDGLGCKFDGKEYSPYEATQFQRSIERSIRKLKREKVAYNAAGLIEKERAVSIRLRRLNAKYKAFSKSAGLPEQKERLKVLY